VDLTLSDKLVLLHAQLEQVQSMVFANVQLDTFILINALPHAQLAMAQSEDNARNALQIVLHALDQRHLARVVLMDTLLTLLQEPAKLPPTASLVNISLKPLTDVLAYALQTLFIMNQFV
jgi:hypothetical protein